MMPIESAHASRRTPGGFTLIELLVTIAVIAALLGLLLPAMQSAREAARRTRCLNNLKQIALGLHGYHDSNGRFPPGGWEWRPFGNTTKRQLAWSMLVLPFLEESRLYDTLNVHTPYDSRANVTGAATILSLYLCPTSRRDHPLVQTRGACDYGGMFGERITGPNNPPKGAMIYDRAFGIADLRDGTAQTVIIGEDTWFTDGQWINGRNVFDQAFPINKAPLFENDMRSDHPGGALALMAGGNARFLRETMDARPLAAICTRAGGEILSSDQY